MNYDDAVLQDEPVMYFKMNETSGDFLDSSGNGYTATVFGTVTRNSQYATVDDEGGASVGTASGYAIVQQPMTCDPDQCVIELWYARMVASTTTTNQFLVGIPHYPRIKNSQVHSTLSAVLSYNASHGDRPGTLFNRAITTNINYASNRDDDNFNTNELGESHYNHGFTLSALTKHHLVIASSLRPATNGDRYNDYRRRIYVDGVQRVTVGSDPYTLAYPDYDFGPGLFCLPSTSMTPIGTPVQNVWLSKVAIYNKPLSPARILAHYQAGTNTESGNRVAGTVLLDGAATGGFQIFVHRRDTGALIGRGRSLANGAFNVYVGSYSGQVYAVALDTVTGKPYPAQVFDLITPST